MSQDVVGVAAVAIQLNITRFARLPIIVTIMNNVFTKMQIISKTVLYSMLLWLACGNESVTNLYNVNDYYVRLKVLNGNTNPDQSIALSENNDNINMTGSQLSLITAQGEWTAPLKLYILFYIFEHKIFHKNCRCNHT